MTAGQYRTLLLKHWRLIILCSVLMGAAVALGSLVISSPYQSTATLQLVYLPAHTPVPPSAAETLQTELNLVTSDSILSQVAADYPGLTVAQLKSEIAAQAVSTTRLIQITVSDHNAS